MVVKTVVRTVLDNKIKATSFLAMENIINCQTLWSQVKHLHHDVHEQTKSYKLEIGIR